MNYYLNIDGEKGGEKMKGEGGKGRGKEKGWGVRK